MKGLGLHPGPFLVLNVGEAKSHCVLMAPCQQDMLFLFCLFLSLKRPDSFSAENRSYARADSPGLSRERKTGGSFELGIRISTQA